MCHGRSGCGRTRGDDFLCPCSALNVKLVRNSKQARTNDRSNHDSHNGGHVCSECHVVQNKGG